MKGMLVSGMIMMEGLTIVDKSVSFCSEKLFSTGEESLSDGVLCILGIQTSLRLKQN